MKEQIQSSEQVFIELTEEDMTRLEELSQESYSVRGIPKLARDCTWCIDEIMKYLSEREHIDDISKLPSVDYLLLKNKIITFLGPRDAVAISTERFLQNLGLDIATWGQALDLAVANMAKDLQIPVASLDDIVEGHLQPRHACAVSGKTERAAADFFRLVSDSIRAQEARESWPKLLTSYRQGNIERTLTLSEDRSLFFSESPEDPCDANTMRERNVRWARILTDHLLGGQKVFVAGGAAHLAGDDNVIDMLDADPDLEVRYLGPRELHDGD